VNPIPEHVAAYAAGLRTGSSERGRRPDSFELIAAVVKSLGMGDYRPAELESAARAWAQTHTNCPIG
jgi:hypothetical protein